MVKFEKDIERSIEVLRKGGLILYPTDTVWGIGCDATNPKAVEKVFALKKRPEEKALIVLLADQRDILQYVAAPDPHIFEYLDTLAMPTTVIYQGAIGLADNLGAKDGSIAIRICRENFCRHLLKRFRKPLVSTSANLSGDPPPKNFNEIAAPIKSGVDYVVNYRQDDVSVAEPSTVVRWENGKVTVIRP